MIHLDARPQSYRGVWRLHHLIFYLPCANFCRGVGVRCHGWKVPGGRLVPHCSGWTGPLANENGKANQPEQRGVVLGVDMRQAGHQSMLPLHDRPCNKHPVVAVPRALLVYG